MAESDEKDAYLVHLPKKLVENLDIFLVKKRTTKEYTSRSIFIEKAIVERLKNKTKSGGIK
tara:strand:- start:348 stop:530 length:183 start_codon:yes stop_codon:yes gene_type:complete